MAKLQEAHDVEVGIDGRALPRERFVDGDSLMVP